MVNRATTSGPPIINFVDAFLQSVVPRLKLKAHVAQFGQFLYSMLGVLSGFVADVGVAIAGIPVVVVVLVDGPHMQAVKCRRNGCVLANGGFNLIESGLV